MKHHTSNSQEFTVVGFGCNVIRIFYEACVDVVTLELLFIAEDVSQMK